MKQKKRTGRRLLSFLLTLAMVMGLLPGMSMTVYAGSEVSYQEGSWSNNSVAYATKTAANPTTLASDTTAWGDGNWYVVPANGVTISDRISVTGTVNLILTDGNTLTASKGITVADGNTLNIYAQSEGNNAGVLLINSVDDNNSGIGGGTTANDRNAGALIIHGGKIVASGGQYGAGIGGGYMGNGGIVTIYGGAITAAGGRRAAGIGGGEQYNSTGGNGGEVTIFGGTVTATGGYNGAGIGGGNVGSGGTVTIHGGTVTATGNTAADGGAGIGAGNSGSGGTVTIDGGTVTATGANRRCMGIGGIAQRGNWKEVDGQMVQEITPPQNGSLTVGDGLKLYGGDSANPTTEISQEELSKINTSQNTTVYQYMIVSGPLHEHNFTYSVNGDTITATCTADGCDLPEVGGKHTATLTIAPSSSGGYGASLSGDAAEFGVTDTNIEYSSDNGATWNTTVPSTAGSYQARIQVTDNETTTTATVSYGVHTITTDKTYTAENDHGTLSVSAVAAAANTTVTIETTPAAAFQLESLTVTKASGETVAVTINGNNGTFTMPAENVTVSATFVGKDTTATLTVDGSGGTAALLDDSYNEVESLTKKAGEKFILLVNRDDEYDFNVKNGNNNISITEFTEQDYKKYIAYAEKNNISISANTVLAWITMPGAENGSVALTVNFSKPKTFTILYQPAAETNPDIVACKIVRNVNNAEEVSYTFLQRGATMSDGTAVWSMKMTAAFPPTKIAFVPSSTPTTDEQKTDLTNTITNAVLNDAIVSQNTSSWNDLSGAKYLIIGGNAKVVTAAFITDTSAMTTYKDNTASAATSTSGVTYQIAVCGTDASGNVTSFGTVKAPAAPAAPEGKEFAGWRGFEYQTVSSKATEKIYSAGDTINVRDNATFTAVWKPAKLTVKLNPNGGTNVSNPDPVTYGEKLPKLEDPTRSGFAFDGWTVSKAVTENGVAFAKGSTFDLDTPITANLNLTAQWKHVHSYTCYQISDFGDRLAKYQKYETALHIAVCSCGDLDLVAHEFDSDGKCACGYQKPGAATVTLKISYGQWLNNAYTEKMQGVPETAKQGQEVSISAPPTWGNLEFSKWQYSAGDGQWVDLTAYNYASFIIPATMQVRALYINPVTVPQVDLSARKCDDQTEVNGQTYTMDNILFHLNYKLPDGYTFEDAGIRLGDNNGISYYFIQQVRYSYDNETKGILSGITVGLVALDYLTGNLTSYDVGTGMFAEEYSVNYLETEDNVLDKELDAATLAKYMYESKPVNVEKYDPIYWEAKAVTKGMSGSMETIPPLRFAQKYGGRNYIYGIGYLRYKDKDGKIHTIYTEALPTAVKDMPKYTVTATPDGKTNTKQN